MLENKAMKEKRILERISLGIIFLFPRICSSSTLWKRNGMSPIFKTRWLLTGHSIDFGNTKILAKSENLTTRIAREAIEIRKRPKSLNKRDDRQRFSHTWKPLLTNPANKTQADQDELRSLHKHKHQSHNTQTSGPNTQSHACITSLTQPPPVDL
ncbi:hypothetical protein Trydic_g8465 [Trypoxylus dichotomus]